MSQLACWCFRNRRLVVALWLFALVVLTVGGRTVGGSFQNDFRIAGAESQLLAFGEDFRASAVMAEAPHGTAPTLQGKNVANPMAMILGAAALLGHADEPARRASEAIREACLEAVGDGIRTADLGGHAGTSEFTDEIISRVRSKLAS